MSAPIYEIKKNYEVPEYTIDSFMARDDWNKEISNNKQGYMGVDIMSMKDFYDAGGYTFVDDYRAELQQIDAEYDRAIPGYGVKGEQMASAGLTGSGFGDYLSGQAYAARAKGQALARQNIMANSNSFRAAYNEYVTRQKDKREQNLQTVIEKAYNSAMDPEMFVEMATKLGIPQADAERGKGVLEAYYMGVNKNQYGLTDTEQEQASSLIQQITSGVGSYANTDAIKNLILSTSTNKNAETIFNAALQQAKMAVMTDLQGMIANGESYTTEELDRIKAYYGFTDEELGSIYTDMQAIEENNKGTIDPEQQATANAYADLFMIGLYGGELTDADGNKQTVKAGKLGNISDILINKHLDPEDPVVKAGIAEFQKITAANVESAIGKGQYVTKAELDRLAEFGAFEGGKDSEVYKKLLASAQRTTAEKLIDAIMSGYADDEIAALEYLGIDVSSVDENNCENLLIEAAEEAYKDGDITSEQLKTLKVEEIKKDMSDVSDSKDFEKIIINANKDGLTSKDLAETLGNVSVSTYSKTIGSKNSVSPNAMTYMEVNCIKLTLENGSTVEVSVNVSDSSDKEAIEAISASNANKASGKLIGYKDKIYMQTDKGEWKAVSISEDKNKILEKALAEIFQYNPPIDATAAASGAITPNTYTAASNQSFKVQHKLPAGIGTTVK